MKILDRYVLRAFLFNYLISFMVLIGMYIVLDMVFNFDELSNAKGNAQLSTLGLVGQIADYYFHQMFLIFVHLSGIIPVVAAGFTLIRLSRFNELSAILAAGIPLLQVTRPIIIAAVLLQILLAVDQELIIPNIIPKLTGRREEISQQSPERSFPVQAMQDAQGGLLFAGKYVQAPRDKPPTMYELDIIERDEQLQPAAHISAASAEWDEAKQSWKLTRGRRVTGLLPHQTPSPEIPIDFYKSDVTPEEILIYHNSKFVNLLARDKIDQLIQRGNQVYGTIDLLRVKHFRLAQLVMNIVMLLIAIPCVLTRDPGQMKMSIMQCLLLIGLSMAAYFIAFQFAGRPPTGVDWAAKWPAMMAAVPIIIFGPVAVFLLERLPT